MVLGPCRAWRRVQIGAHGAERLGVGCGAEAAEILCCSSTMRRSHSAALSLTKGPAKSSPGAGRFDRLGAAARVVASGGRGWRPSLGDERVVASRSRRSAMAVAHGCLAGGPGDRCQVFEQVRAAQRVPAGVVVPVQPPAVVHRGAGQGVRSPAWSKRHAPARPPIDVVSCDAIAYLTDGRM